MYYSLTTKRGISFRTKAQKYKDYIDDIHQALAHFFSDKALYTIFKEHQSELIRLLAIKVEIPKKDWETLKGKLKRHDASNFIKPTEDAFFKFLQEKLMLLSDDNQVEEVRCYKVKTDKLEWSITLEFELNKEQDKNYEYSYIFKKE